MSPWAETQTHSNMPRQQQQQAMGQQQREEWQCGKRSKSEEKNKHTQHQQQAMRACVAIWSGRQKKNQSRCCLALCKIPNSTGLSTVDAKCQLYHKTKAVGKVHKQFCHSPFTLKCTYIQTVCMRIYIYISRYEFTNLKPEIRQYFEIPQHSNAHHLLVTQ